MMYEDSRTTMEETFVRFGCIMIVELMLKKEKKFHSSEWKINERERNFFFFFYNERKRKGEKMKLITSLKRSGIVIKKK